MRPNDVVQIFIGGNDIPAILQGQAPNVTIPDIAVAVGGIMETLYEAGALK